MTTQENNILVAVEEDGSKWVQLEDYNSLKEKCVAIIQNIPLYIPLSYLSETTNGRQKDCIDIVAFVKNSIIRQIQDKI